MNRAPGMAKVVGKPTSAARKAKRKGASKLMHEMGETLAQKYAEMKSKGAC
jgi:hypothetical protein